VIVSICRALPEVRVGRPARLELYVQKLILLCSCVDRREALSRTYAWGVTWKALRRSTLRCWRNDIPAPVARLHTNCCKQVQEDEEIQNDIDVSSIKPKLKSRR